MEIKSKIQDYNLNATRNVPYDTRSVLIIGTAADGPVNTPVRINDLKDAREIFGSPNDGTLVKAIYEVFYSTNGVRPDVRAVRIGGGAYATLQIDEKSTGTGREAPTSGMYALKLEALVPGEIYNNVTIKTAIVNNRLSIVIYNPKTGVESVYTYSPNPDTSADVHSAVELANMINNDTNLNTIIRATVPNLEAYYEIDLTQNMTSLVDAYDTSEGIVTLTLSGLPYTDGIIDNTRDPYDGRSKKAPATALDKIRTLSRVYELAIANQLIDGEGASSFQLLGPVLALDTTVNPILPLDADLTDATHKQYSEFRQIIRRKYVGTVSDASTFSGTMKMDLYLPPNVSETGSNDWLGDYVSGVDMPDWYESHVDYVYDDSRDLVIVYVKRGDTFQPINDLLGIDDRTSIYSLSWDYNERKLTITFESFVKNHLEDGDEIYIDIDTVVGVLTKVDSIGAVKNADDFTKYFVAGNTIYFGDPLPSPITITYSYKREYEVGSDVELADPKSGKLRFINTFMQPGFYNVDPYKDTTYTELICHGITLRVVEATGLSDYLEAESHPYANSGSKVASTAALMRGGYADRDRPPVTRKPPEIPDAQSCYYVTHSTSVLKFPMWLGLEYTYEPEEMDLTSAMSLSGGSNGTNLSTETMYRELQKTFESLVNFPADIVTLTGAYFDDYVKVFNEYTGVEEYKNAGIHKLFAEYLYNLSQNVSETIGVMALRPLTGNLTAKSINEYYERLIEVKYSDPTRPANVMAATGDYKTKHLVVTAFEPIVNYPVSTVPYSTTGEAIYTGILMSLKPNETPINQRLKVQGMRYLFTNEQLIKLAEKRYTVVKFLPNFGFRIAADPTLAPYGSDYSMLSTLMEVFEVSNGIRNLAQRYLGSKNTEAIRTSLQQQIDKYLANVVNAGVVSRAYAVVRTDSNKIILGELDIDLTIVPAFEIRTITINIKVTAG